MDQYQFSRQFKKLQSRIRELQVQPADTTLQQQDLLREALEYLGNSIEELSVAEEELRQQNEDLASIRDELEEGRNRYSDLFEFAPDGYLVTSEAGIVREANHIAASLLNYPQERLRNKVLANFIYKEERTTFRNQLSKLTEGSGSQEWIFRIQPRNAQPFFASLTVTFSKENEDSSPTLRWLMRDITSRVNAERTLAQKTRQIQLLQEIASASNLTNSVDEALQFAVDRICAFTGWPVGHVYLTRFTPTPELVATKIWHLDEPEKFATFKQVTEETRLIPGKGLSGRVLASGKPEWVVDVIKDPGFARLSIPEDRPVRAGLFFPILIREEVAGVLEFFATVRVEPDENLLDMMAHIGAQLGRVVERDRAQAALKAREEMLQAAGNIAPVVNFIIDRNGVIQLSIGKSLARLRYSIDPIGHSIFDLFHDTPEIIEGFQSALAGNTLSTIIETEGLVFDTHYAPLKNEKGEILGVIGAAADITQFRQMVEELRKSENRFRTIFSEADLGMVLVDLHCQIVESNPAFQEMLGYTKNDFEGTCLLDYLGRDDLSHKKMIYEDLFSGKTDHFHLEERYRRKDGSLIWTNERVSLLRDENGHPQYAIAMIENISIKKQMEAELYELERRLFEGVETDRLQLAQDLHDGPLQDLYSATFQLSGLEGKAHDVVEQQTYIETRATIQQVIHTLRSICGELRPPALAPFGLEKAIRSHAEQLQDLHPETKINLDLMKDGQELQEPIRIALFRIYQQILINVIRHAQASQVNVRFEFNDHQITLAIRDNGRGFKVPERWIELVRQGHFGLVGAAERAEALGGRLRIKSWQGAGTVIHIVIPRQVDYQTALERPFSTLIPQLEAQDPSKPENL